jgi:cytochrome c551
MVSVLSAVLLAGCGGDKGSSSGGGGTSKADLKAGRTIFQNSCKQCHTLADADAAGTFGPNLDTLKPDADRVRLQIMNGGGGMPAGVVKGKDADTVAEYVASVAGK